MKVKIMFMGFYYGECKMHRAQIYTQGILRDSLPFWNSAEVFFRPGEQWDV